MSVRLRTVLVDGAFLLVSGIEQLLSEFPDIVLVEVFDGSEKNLADKIIKLKPEIIIINPGVLKDEPVSIINKLQKQNDFVLIGLVGHLTVENVKSHFTSCLNINNGKFELIEELKSILGKRFFSSKENKKDTGISDREKTIIKAVVSGLTNQEIANKLFLSIHTVTTHRKNITNKLGIKTVSGLTVYAIMNKIVDIHEIEHK